MKNCTYRFYSLAFLLSLSGILHAHVNVLYPVGGETFIQGYTVIVEWEIAQPHDLLDWDVYYSTDAGETWIPLGIDLPPSQLTYEWVIPAVETTLGKIKVYMNNSGDDYIDYSGEFTIVPNTSPPAIDVPAEDLILPCNISNQQAAIQAWLNNHGNASIIHFCGNLVWTNDYTALSNDCGATGEAYVTFTATDQCGSTSTTALLRVEDHTPPTLTSPAANATVETDGQGNVTQLNTWLNSRGGAIATDACGPVTWSNDFTAISIACGQAGSSTVTFTVIDACGNANTTVATFLITDQVDPTILQAAQNLSIPLSAASDSLIQNWLDNHGGADAYDLGGAVTWQHNFNALTGCGASGITSVAFTATDPCGNKAVTIASLQVIDQAPPVFQTTAIDQVVACGNSNSQLLLQQWLDAHAGASATDLGGDVTWAHNFNSLSDGCGLSGSATVTFTASDPCGNSASTIGTFQLTDTIAPVIDTAPRDTTVYCPNDITTLLQRWLNQHGGGSAIDQCGDVHWTHNFNAVIDSCRLMASYPVTFTAVDECLNSQQASATFTIIDTTITAVLNISAMDFKAFPNPVDDVLTVEWENNESAVVQLMLLDAAGRNVWSGRSTSARIMIPVDAYTPGVYFLSCKRKNSAGMRMVIIE